VNIRDEAVLRELNLYPLWVRRGAPADAEPAPAPIVPVEEVQPAVAASREPEVHPSATPVASSLSWPELKQKVHDCTACRLRAGCRQTVFGVGDEKAEWLFVGEGPGADEDVQGEPFVGQAGKLLDNMLAAIKLKRGSNVYIANIVKCRPPNNRTPEPDEIATCLPYLQRQIELIKPKLIVALGKTAATSLLGRDATLGSLRGTIHNFQGIPLLITYHPAYLLRSPAEKAKAWQDLRFAVQRMAE
jgi:uracil-DNA glycosylase